MTFGLGTWQIQRKIWKENLIKQMDDKLNMEPIPIPENLDYMSDMEYQNITVRGHFINERELLIGPRGLINPKGSDKHGGGVFSTQNASSGFLVITPFKVSLIPSLEY